MTIRAVKGGYVIKHCTGPDKGKTLPGTFHKSKAATLRQHRAIMASKGRRAQLDPPTAVERRLKARAAKLQRAGKLHGSKEAYIYSTLRKIEQAHRAKGGKAGKYMKRKV